MRSLPRPWLAPLALAAVVLTAAIAEPALATPPRSSTSRCRSGTCTRGHQPHRRPTRAHRSRGGDPPLPESTTPAQRGPTPSRSFGRAAAGRLINGVPLEPAAFVRVKSPDHRYGTAELVDMIAYAAQKVSDRFPGSSLLVGDLSRETGGRLTSHRSHRSGRDADIGFYVLDQEGAQATVTRFVRFGVGGRPLDGNGANLTFDVARNWEFVRHMVEFPNAQVQYLFVYQPLADMMLEYAATQNVPESTMVRARQILSGEHRSGRHDNHFHVRIHCPAGDEGCVNNEGRRRRRGGNQRARSANARARARARN